MQRLGIHLWNYLVAASVLLLLCSNAAQPGIWNAGGGGFNFLYPEDSTAFRKIQMQSESIAIQLYPGFAVVKGTYRMLNTTSDTIKIKVGYPVEGIYAGNEAKLTEIDFSSLKKLKVLQDGMPRPIIEAPTNFPHPNTRTFQNNNWYIWESTFLPDTWSELSVYFIVNTNEAKILLGYTKDRNNAFIYILESGRIWKQPIEEATFKVQLKGGLEMKSIHGVSNTVDFGFDPVNNLLYGTKSQFTPLPSDNLLINYGKRLEAFTYSLEISRSEALFRAVDELAALEIDLNSLEPYEEEDPFIVHGINPIPWVLAFVFIGMPILLILGLRYLWRIAKKR